MEQSRQAYVSYEKLGSGVAERAGAAVRGRASGGGELDDGLDVVVGRPWAGARRERAGGYRRWPGHVLSGQGEHAGVIDEDEVGVRTGRRTAADIGKWFGLGRQAPSSRSDLDEDTAVRREGPELAELPSRRQRTSSPDIPSRWAPPGTVRAGRSTHATLLAPSLQPWCLRNGQSNAPFYCRSQQIHSDFSSTRPLYIPHAITRLIVQAIVLRYILFSVQQPRYAGDQLG